MALKVVSYPPAQGLLVVNRFRFASCPMSSSSELLQMDAKRPVSVTSQMSPIGPGCVETEDIELDGAAPKARRSRDWL